jgi:hypothetical protein
LHRQSPSKLLGPLHHAPVLRHLSFANIPPSRRGLFRCCSAPCSVDRLEESSGVSPRRKEEEEKKRENFLKIQKTRSPLGLSPIGQVLEKDPIKRTFGFLLVSKKIFK